MKDVSNRMLGQFADNLSQLIQSGGRRVGAPPRSNGPQPATSSDPCRPATFTPANDQGIDAVGLLLGSDAVKRVTTPALVGVTGLLIGYLYGKNRTLERMVRRGL